MNKTQSEEIIIANFWLEATNQGITSAWNDDFEEFKEQYYGNFRSLESYAQHMIEEWDRSNLIPFQLSSSIKPSDVISDAYYMAEVYTFYGPNPENPDEEVVHIFHTQGYYDRMDR